jgi:hypothetical protein
MAGAMDDELGDETWFGHRFHPSHW